MMNSYQYRNEVDVRNRIIKNHGFIAECKEIFLHIKDFEMKCSFAEFVGDVWSKCITGVYTDADIENIIIQMSHEIETRIEEKKDDSNALIVMTKSAKGGGHTLLATNWVQWDEKNKYSLVMTNQYLENIPAFLADSITNQGGKVYSLEGSYYERARDLRAISNNYSYILLITHMNDIIPILAYGVSSFIRPVFFYNHADFRFSYGFSISDAVLNLFEIDTERTKRLRGIYDAYNVTLPFPNNGDVINENELTLKSNDLLNKKSRLANKYNFEIDDKIIVSAGQNYKYSDILECSFSSYVEKIMRKVGANVRFLIIGPDPKLQKWERLSTKTNGKAKALGYIDREDMEGLIEIADLYVVSFPKEAHGASNAIRYNTPFLAYGVTERVCGMFERENIALSEAELVRKTIDILDKNIKNYRYSGDFLIAKSDWQNRWGQIINEVKEHRIRKISPIEEVGIDELVNCQMMQTSNGIDEIDDVILGCCMNDKIFGRLLGLMDRYELPIMPDCFFINLDDSRKIREQLKIAENLAKKINKWNERNFSLYLKYDRLYQYSSKWLELELKGESIAEYLKEKKYRKIAIWGLGNMGKNLFSSLKMSDIEIQYAIDIHNKKCECEVLVLDTPMKVSDIDVIINTTYDECDVLKNSCSYDGEIISLFDIIDDMFNMLESKG